jgi:hypothetical protein
MNLAPVETAGLFIALTSKFLKSTFAFFKTKDTSANQSTSQTNDLSNGVKTDSTEEFNPQSTTAIDSTDQLIPKNPSRLTP